MLRQFLLPALLAFVAAAPAAAQSTQSADPDASSVKIGPIGMTPTLVFRDIGRDENVFNDKDDPKRDFTFTVSPGARVLIKPRGMRISYTSTTDYVYYQKYKSERSTNSSSSARVDFNLARFQPFVLASGNNSKERLNQEVDKRAKHRERVYGGGLALKFGTLLTLGGSARSTRLRFDPGTGTEGEFRGESLSRAFDSTVRAYDISAGLQLTTFTLMTISAAREEQRFTVAHERDADSLRIAPTFTFSPQAVLNGGVSFGYRRFTPRSAALPPYSGLVATATVGTTLWSRHHLDMIFARDLRYSYENDTPYYLMTAATLTVTTQLVGPFDVRGSGTRQLLAYRGNRLVADDDRPGDDTYTGYGGGFGYRIGERARIGVNMEWSRRESQLSAEREFRNRRIVGSLTWGKQ